MGYPSITTNQYLNSVDNFYHLQYRGNYKYGDSHGWPPCSDHVTSCDRGDTARPLYDLGFTDQPRTPTSGITVVNMEECLTKYGFMKIKNQSDLKPGDIVLMKIKGQSKPTDMWHTFTLTAYNNKTGMCSKYDFGSQPRLRSPQPFKNVQLNEWTNREFYCAFRVPDNIKRLPTKGLQLYVIESAVDRRFAVDIIGASMDPKANVQCYSKNGTAAQKFAVESIDGGSYVRIINQKSGLVLDVSGGKATNKRNVWQYPWNASKAQKWIKSKNSDGSFTFKSAIDPNYVLDLYAAKAKNKTNIQIYKSNGTKAQKWFLAPTK